MGREENSHFTSTQWHIVQGYKTELAGICLKISLSVSQEALPTGGTQIDALSPVQFHRRRAPLPPSEMLWSDAPTIPSLSLFCLLVQCMEPRALRILGKHSVMEHSLLFETGSP